MDLSLLLLIPNNTPPIDQSCGNRVFKSSCKKLLHMSQMLIICNECRKNMTVEIKQQNGMGIIGRYIVRLLLMQNQNESINSIVWL